MIGRLLRRGVQAYRQGNMWVESGSERGGGRERERERWGTDLGWKEEDFFRLK